MYGKNCNPLWVKTACGREQFEEQLKDAVFQKRSFFYQPCQNLNAAALFSVLM